MHRIRTLRLLSATLVNLVRELDIDGTLTAGEYEGKLRFYRAAWPKEWQSGRNGAREPESNPRFKKGVET
jgi:hypothetical protein